jgi:DNA mismatch repair protein MutS
VALQTQLPALRATLASVRSVTIGVNIGPDLAPVSATILGFSDEAIEGRRALVWRLLGGAQPAGRGVTPLQRGEAGPLGRPNELVRDLRQLMSQVIGPVQSALDQFAGVSTQALSRLGGDLAFLVGAARLVERLRAAGMPMCCPALAPWDERGGVVDDVYDLGLTLAQLGVGPTPAGALGIVTNRVTFDGRHGRVWVLTGPNRGGKTTYTRAVGLAQVLFQAGLYVPGSSARLSPVDAIFTHFPTREDTRPGLGRLDAEAERLATIFRVATPRSLILLNEALAGTSALEALDLARGIVRGLRLLGARAIYVTHLHELASEVDAINAGTPGDGTVASLLAEASQDQEAGTEGAGGAAGPERIGGRERPSDAERPGGPERPGRSRRTYRIQPGAPRGASFAAEIAEHHGISFAQLARLLQDRNVLLPSADAP